MYKKSTFTFCSYTFTSNLSTKVLAATAGFAHVIERLCDARADPDGPVKGQPLLLAVQAESPGCVRALLGARLSLVEL